MSRRVTLRQWKLTKLPKYYGVIGTTDLGTEVAVYTQLAPIDKGDHFLVQNLIGKSDLVLYKGEGVSLLEEKNSLSLFLEKD